MNPLMSNPMGNIMQIANQISRIKQNPNGLADFLKERGCVSDEQYTTIQSMGGNYGQVGQYLMQTGALSQQQVMQAAQVAPRFQV